MTIFFNAGFRGLFCKTLFLTTATCALTFPIHAFGQSAPAPAASSCDPAYYDTLQSRAWLEAQREITQNQNLIFKPDSVLQYTCFDKHLGAVKKAIEGADASAYYPSSIAVANNDSGDVNVGSFVGDVLQSLVGVQPAYAQNLFLTPDSSANTSTFGGIGAQPSVTTTTNTAVTTIQNAASQAVSSATNLQNINASTITSQLTSQLTSSALQQVQSLIPSMTPALQQQLNSALNSAVGSALTSSVQNSITGALSNAASGTINNAVTNAVQNSINNTLQNSALTQNVNKAITDTLSSTLSPAAASSIANAVSTSLSSTIASATGGLVSSVLGGAIGGGGGGLLGGAAGPGTGFFSEEAKFDYVGRTASTFVAQNFTNDPDGLLGGRSGIKATLSSSLSSGDYNCDVMDNVWKEARCMNFVDEAGSDAFYTLAEYVSDSQDKRFKKGSCSKSPSWTSESDKLKPSGTAWEEDTIETFLEKFDPSNCSSKLETGIQIHPNTKDTAGKPETFSIPPGCPV